MFVKNFEILTYKALHDSALLSINHIYLAPIILVSEHLSFVFKPCTVQYLCDRSYPYFTNGKLRHGAIK